MKRFSAIILIIISLFFSGILVQAETINDYLKTDLSYQVKPGDSLYKLARQYGTTITLIKTINNLQSDLILIGQLLQIPVPGDKVSDNTYIVKPGDSLYKLALKFNTTIQKLKQFNQLTSDIIYVDQKLIISRLDETKVISISGKVSISNKTKRAEVRMKKDEKISTEMVSALNTLPEDTEFTEGEIIVKYKPLNTPDSLNTLEKDIGVAGVETLNRNGSTIVRYQKEDNIDIKDFVEKFEDKEEVEWVEPNYIYYPAAIPSDSYYNYHQWNLQNINMEAAWDLEKGDNSVIVAVLDTGIIKNHPDLKNNLLQGVDFIGGSKNPPVSSYEITDPDPSDETTLVDGGSHGTHVSGILGAVTNNYRGIAGLNWQVKILPVRVLKKSGGTSWNITEGIYYAIDRGAKVINMSLGGSHMSQLTEEAIKEAVAAGITVVAAAGNEGNNDVYYPAAFADVIAVGAVDKYNQRTSYSNFGNEIDLVAPGGGYGGSIYSTWGYYDPENKTSISSYGGMIGTSMATPHVSGLAALLIANGIEDPGEVRQHLQKSAIDLGSAGKDRYYGYGLVDGYGALLGKKLRNPQVFAGMENNGVIEVKSEMIQATDNGYFKLENVTVGKLKIYGWRDVNQNGIIDKGDYYGVSLRTYESQNNIEDIKFEIEYISSSNLNIKIQK